MRITQAAGYAEPRDSISHDWLDLLQIWDIEPYPIPNGIEGMEKFLDTIEPGIFILTGGDDPGTGDRRDQTEKQILEYAAATNTPVLGVCRGLQAINLHFGGALGQVDGHVGVQHVVQIHTPFTEIYGGAAEVNSFHKSSVPASGLARTLIAAGVDQDGNIEALVHPSQPVAAIMWHPERGGAPAADRQLIERLAREGAFWH